MYNINRKSLTVAENVEIKVIFGLGEKLVPGSSSIRGLVE